MKTPLISVIMPAYNAEKLIATAIKSILEQTFSDFEFIIINDGSTDKTAKIIKSFIDERIVLIDKPKNAGLISALNDGIEIAKGEFIARMDADDESLPQRFKLQIEFMQNNSVDILGTASTLFVFDGNKSIAATAPATHKQCMDKLLTTPCISHPTAMIRKSALGAIRYNEQYQFAEDYKLWVDLAKNGAKFANLQTPLLKYNLHGGNISITKIEEQSKCARVIRREYFIYYFAGKTAALQTIKEFYRTEKLSLREVRVIIRENIDLIKFSSDTNAKILAYYLRYKIKEFFKK